MLSRNMDVFVVPSRWSENSPNIILEAQAMKVPVVAAHVREMPELVRHNTDGLLFEPDDVAAPENCLA